MNSKTYKGYTIYEDGSVIGKFGKKITPSIDRGGYCVFSTHFGNKKATEKIHRVVAYCFIPNEHNKPEVNHIDCNKQNNHVRNLEWVTKSENIKHAYSSGLMENARKVVGENGRKWLKKINSKKVIDNSTGIIYPSAKEVSEKFGINQTTLCHWLSGYRKNKSNFNYINN